MTLPDLTALLSRVSKDNPKLMESREVGLFIEACIEKQRAEDECPHGRVGIWPAPADAPFAPVDDPNSLI